MTTATNWKQVSRTISLLKLDTRNPRIPHSDKEFSQRELIEELLLHSRVEKLAKDIVEHGYYIVESLIGVEEDGNVIIVEGNRRLAALKLLLSPEKAPSPKEVKKFQKLSALIDASTIRKVSVAIAPTRQAALNYIRNKHTQLGFEKWSPVMQAKFYHDTMEEEEFSLSNIARFFGMAPSEITQNLQFYKMYEIAASLDLPEQIKEAVDNIHDFPMTTVERFYKRPEIATALGISFNEKGDLIGSIQVEEFKKGYAKIITDVATKKVTSRTHNKSDNFKDYLKNLGADKPNLSKKGSFTAESLLNPKVKVVIPPIKKKAVKKKTATKATKRLFSNKLKCELENHRTNQVFNELYSLKVADQPIATAVLMRILLEDCVSNYLDKTGKMDQLIAEIKRKDKNNRKKKDWYPTLRQQLNSLVQDEDFKLHPLAWKIVIKLTNGNDELLALDSLDSWVHNKFNVATEPNVRALWAGIDELVKTLLVEPDIPNSGEK